jgi:hypothetical protein
MPDTVYAKPHWGSAFPQYDYGMIFCSTGHREELLFVSRMAGRSTPMTGTDRSNLSCRSLLFLFVLLGAPMAARSATLDDSARELAGKIAVALPAQKNISCEIRNVSSLQPDEVARIEEALKAELQKEGISTQASSSATASAVVTLSENLKNFVWAAEIHQGDASQVVFTTIPRPQENRAISSAMPMTLRSEKFWEGREHILDAAVVAMPNSDRWLVLLVPEGLSLRKLDGGPIVTIPVDSFQTKSRSPYGALLNTENPLKVLLDPNICTVSLDPPSLRECQVSPKLVTLTMIPGRGQVTGIRSGCDAGSQVLSSGPGDFAEPDSVQAFEWHDRTPVAVSDEVNFPGPVSFHRISNFEAPVATAVVRNLQTGNYEAYRLSISCGQ